MQCLSVEESDPKPRHFRSRSRTPWSLKTGVAVALAVMVAGTLLAMHRSRSFNRGAARLETEWRTDLRDGVPAPSLAPLKAALASWENRRIFRVLPRVFFGGGPAELTGLRQETTAVVVRATRLAQARALASGTALRRLEGSRSTLSALQLSKSLRQAATPRQFARLTLLWTGAATAWSHAEQTLARESGGLAAGEPQDVVASMQKLLTKLQAANPDWTGWKGAQAALTAARSYLHRSPMQQLPSHQALMNELTAAWSNLAAPGPNPFGTAFQNYLAGRAGTVSAAVYDAEDGVTYTFNPTLDDFDTASIVKATILATLLWQSQASGQPLTPAERQLAVPMIEDSSNAAATKLWFDAGSSTGIGQFLKVAGLTTTTPARGGYWGLTKTSAVDQVELLRLLSYPNAVLTPASQQYEAGLMTHVIAWEDWGVSSGATGGATVALKNGWLPVPGGWEINSMGHIAGNGRNYVVAILSSGNPSEAYGIQTLDNLSQMIWSHMGQGS